MILFGNEDRKKRKPPYRSLESLPFFQLAELVSVKFAELVSVKLAELVSERSLVSVLGGLGPGLALARSAREGIVVVGGDAKVTLGAVGCRNVSEVGVLFPDFTFWVPAVFSASCLVFVSWAQVL